MCRDYRTAQADVNANRELGAAGQNVEMQYTFSSICDKQQVLEE